jgi:ABC-type phosphate transport system ATPase subunit
MNKFNVKDLYIRYSDDNESLRGINLDIEANAITVLFGPAGGGKSTFLRVLNRLNDLADVKQMSGEVIFNGQNILDPNVDVIELRRKIGMVFSRPVPLPLSIYENVAYGLRMAGEHANPNWTMPWSRRYARRSYGRKFTIVWTLPVMPYQAVNNSGSVWPGCSRSNLK